MGLFSPESLFTFFELLGGTFYAGLSQLCISQGISISIHGRLTSTYSLWATTILGDLEKPVHKLKVLIKSKRENRNVQVIQFLL